MKEEREGRREKEKEGGSRSWLFVLLIFSSTQFITLSNQYINVLFNF